MKKLMVLLVLFSFCAEAEAQGFWSDLKGVLKASVPRVSFPAAEQLGLNIRGHNFTAVNGTPLFCHLAVYGKVVAKLGPGDVAYDTRHFEPHWAQIPAVALCYRDEAASQYVGVATEIFNSYGSWGYGTAQTFSVTISRVRTPHGEYEEYPPARARLGTKKVKFPREWWGGTAGVQIVNNSVHDMHIRINGRPRHTLGTGGLYYLAAREVYGGFGAELSIELVFTDRQGNLAGTWDTRFFVPHQDVWAYQYVLGNYDIHRR